MFHVKNPAFEKKKRESNLQEIRRKQQEDQQKREEEQKELERQEQRRRDNAARIARLSKVKPGECVVCLDQGAAEYLVTPCGHTCLCEDCKDDLKSLQNKCPVCRKKIENVNKVYYPTVNVLEE